MAEVAGPELAHLAVDLESRRPAVDEVQLVLLVVVVVDADRARWVGENVDAERSHAQTLPHLPKPVVVAKLVEGRERVSHGADATTSHGARGRESPV